MIDLLVPFLLTLLAFAVATLVVVRSRLKHGAWVYISVVAHVGSAVFQLWLTKEVYGVGDVLMFFRYGELLNAMIDSDPSVAGEVVALFFQQDLDLKFYVFGQGSATGTMVAIATFLLRFLGNSQYAVFVAMALLSWTGKLLLYLALRRHYGEYKGLAVVAMMLPSPVFWTSGLVKESISLGALGLAIWSWTVLSRRPAVAVLGLALGATLMGLSKPYTLVAAIPSFAVWAYLRKSIRSGKTVVIRPVQLVWVLVLASFALVGFGELFPQYSVDRFAEEAFTMQRISTQVIGGSNYQVVHATEGSWAAQLAWAPLGFVTALFRPLVFEAKSVLMLASGIETTLALSFWLLMLFRRGFADQLARVVKDPALGFALVFVIVFGVGVGLTTSNLGTLTRYRAPLVPFMFLYLYVLSSGLQPKGSAT